jgi:hypothetical protein
MCAKLLLERAPWAWPGDQTARFDDGSTATGDVLIGADGASSRVRQQLLPHAERVETGIFAISGKIAMTEAVRRATPQAFLLGPTLVLGPKGHFMFGSAVEYGNSDDKARVNLEPPSTSPPAELPSDREQYVMWGFSAPREAFALPAGCGKPSHCLRDADADRFGVASELMRLAEKMQIPVAVINTAKAVIDETFPHYVGIYNGKASEPHVREAIETSDCLLSIGYRPIEVTTGDFTASLPADTIRAHGQSVAQCRGGGTTAAPTPTPAAAPAQPAPAQPAPAKPTPAAAKPAPTTASAPAGANQFSAEAQAKAHCPADTVVWANIGSRIYHFAGNKNYGNTKEGAYMCERDATAQGIRAAKNEKHP